MTTGEPALPEIIPCGSMSLHYMHSLGLNCHDILMNNVTKHKQSRLQQTMKVTGS